jgi:hypothetical protein
LTICSGKYSISVRVKAPLGGSKYLALFLNGERIGKCVGDELCKGLDECVTDLDLAKYIGSDGRLALVASSSEAVDARPRCAVVVKAKIRDPAGGVIMRETSRCKTTGCSLSMAFSGLEC